MAAVIRPVLCPTPGCKKRLADAASVTVGWIEIKCPRCKVERRIEVSPPANEAPATDRDGIRRAA